MSFCEIHLLFCSSGKTTSILKELLCSIFRSAIYAWHSYTSLIQSAGLMSAYLSENSHKSNSSLKRLNWSSLSCDIASSLYTLIAEEEKYTWHSNKKVRKQTHNFISHTCYVTTASRAARGSPLSGKCQISAIIRSSSSDRHMQGFPPSTKVNHQTIIPITGNP